jgi:hypothetical protein
MAALGPPFLFGEAIFRAGGGNWMNNPPTVDFLKSTKFVYLVVSAILSLSSDGPGRNGKG